MGRTPEEKIVEQEPVPFKTGLELIEMAVGEPRVQWVEMDLSQNLLSRKLRMVGENNVWGTFYRQPFSTSEKKERLLEDFGAVKTDIGDQVEGPSNFGSVPRKLKDLKGEETVLLVFNEGVRSDYPLPGYSNLYEIPIENFNALMEKFRRDDRSISQGELIHGGYSLSAGILSFEFPRPNSDQDFSYGISVWKKRPWGEDVKVGEAMPWIEARLETSRELEQFLVENWHYFEALFGNWQG